MTTLTVSEAKSHFPEIVRNVDKRWLRYVVTKNGKPKAIVLSMAEWEELMETFSVMRDRKLVAELKRGLEQVKSGKTYSFEEVAGRKQKKVSK